MVMSLPSSSFRGFDTATACLEAEADSNRLCIRGVDEILPDFARVAVADVGALHGGARKSR